MHARVGVAGEEDDVVGEREHALVQRRVERARHRAGALGIAPLQVGARDPVGEQGVAADERPVGEEQPGHVGRVAGQGDRADRDVADRDRVAVVQRPHALGVGDAPGQRRRREPQRRGGRVGERPRAGEVVRVQVGVDDVGDRGAEPRGERDVEGRVGRRVDDERLGAGGDEVGEAAAARALDLHDREAVDAEVDRPCLQRADPPPDAALDGHGVDVVRAQGRRHVAGGDAAVAHDDDRAAQRARGRTRVGEHRGGRLVPRGGGGPSIPHAGSSRTSSTVRRSPRARRSARSTGVMLGGGEAIVMGAVPVVSRGPRLLDSTVKPTLQP